MRVFGFPDEAAPLSVGARLDRFYTLLYVALLVHARGDSPHVWRHDGAGDGVSGGVGEGAGGGVGDSVDDAAGDRAEHRPRR